MSWKTRGAPGVKRTVGRRAAPPDLQVRSGFTLDRLTRPQTAYDAAAMNSRQMPRGEYGPIAALLGPLDTLRAASQHEVRNTPLARRAIESTATNVVDTGFRVRTPYRDLQRLWDDWQDECLTSGLLDFAGAQYANVRGVATDGDTAIRFRSRRDGETRTVPLQMQMIEGAQMPSGLTRTAENGNPIVAGVEFDFVGRRVAYHMWNHHPGDFHRLRAVEIFPRRVDGRDVLHCLFPRRLDLDVRGEPWMTPILVKLNDLSIYDENELVRKGTTAMWGGFIRPGTQLAAEEAKDILGGAVAADGTLIEFNPGSFPVLPPGYDVTMAQPSDVGGSYEPFMRMQMLMCAAGMNLTYEQLTGDWRGVSDRQYRASMLEFVRWLHVLQGWHVHQFVKPVWRRFVTDAFASGAWRPPEGSDPLDWFQAEITAPARGYINPLQEVETFIKAVQAGFLSRTRVGEQLGVDVEIVDLENAADMLRAGAAGATYVTHQNPMVAGWDATIVQRIREEVLRDLLAHIERQRDAASDAGPGGDLDA